MNVLTRPLRPGWHETNKPAASIKTDEFEQYVRAVHFPRDSYDLLLKINDIGAGADNFFPGVKPPDFKYVSKKDGFEFFVEAKFRSRFQDQITEWAKLFEARRYQELNPATPEFIAIGVGGRPAAPERVYLVPARDLKFVTQYPSVMQKYELYPGRAVDEKLLRRILE